MQSLEVGQPIEVYDTSRKIWIPGVVVAQWNCANPQAGRWTEYEVSGFDDIGDFRGIWESAYVRLPQSANAGKVVKVPERTEEHQ